MLPAEYVPDEDVDQCAGSTQSIAGKYKWPTQTTIGPTSRI